VAVLVTRDFESGVQNHVTWFSATVTQNTTDAHGGTDSLQWAQLAASSGVQLDNFPYFQVITAGNDYAFTLWYKESVATMPTATWNITFEDGSGNVIAGGPHLAISMPRVTSWTMVTDTVVAPSGATGVKWELQTSSGSTSTMLIDDIAVEDVLPAQDEGTYNDSALAAMGNARGAAW
jgi:hypothetical protein